MTDALWRPPPVSFLLPRHATPEQMTTAARQLTLREQSQVLTSFQNGNYEMASTFLWARAMAGLKKQLASLGVQFLAELLERPDIKPQDAIANVITDYEALRLAEQLQMFAGTEAMRLRHAMELVSHFSEVPEGDETEREMMQEEALTVLRACVQSILGHEKFVGVIEFRKFRQRLEEETFQTDSSEIVSLVAAPSFFQRTTLRVLLAMTKTETGASLQHALANLELVIELLWSDYLTKPDKWLIGKTYAELSGSGNKVAAAAIGRSLAAREGFDFVPESLRSNSFIRLAQRVLEAHHGFNNFYNEPEPMKLLSLLGSTIPEPALAECITATLAVKLGNFYGVSMAAQEHANRVLEKVRTDNWVYYFDEVFPHDQEILGKLDTPRSKTIGQWQLLVEEKGFHSLQLERNDVMKLLAASRGGGDSKSIIDAAETVQKNARTGSAKRVRKLA